MFHFDFTHRHCLSQHGVSAAGSRINLRSFQTLLPLQARSLSSDLHNQDYQEADDVQSHACTRSLVTSIEGVSQSALEMQ